MFPFALCDGGYVSYVLNTRRNITNTIEYKKLEKRFKSTERQCQRCMSPTRKKNEQ